MKRYLKPKHRVYAAIYVCCTVLCLASVLGMAAWYARGGRVLSVQTGSMEPIVHAGDAVLITKLHNRPVRVGDVISYRTIQDPKVVITHRVIKITGAGKQLITKGDASNNVDVAIDTEQVIGRVTWRAPGLGLMLQRVRSPIGLLICLFVPAAIIIGREIKALSIRARQVRYRDVSFRA